MNEEGRSLSNCPGKCKIGKLRSAHPDLVQTVDEMLIDNRQYKEIIDLLDQKVPNHGITVSNISTHRNAPHMLIKPPERLNQLPPPQIKSDSSQPVGQQIVKVTIDVPRRDADLLKKYSLTDVVQKLQWLDEELERFRSIPPESWTAQTHSKYLEYLDRWQRFHDYLTKLNLATSSGKNIVGYEVISSLAAELKKGESKSKGNDNGQSSEKS